MLRAEADYKLRRLRANSIEAAYLNHPLPGSQPKLTLLSATTTASSSRASTIKLLAIVGGIAGLVMGIAMALLMESPTRQFDWERDSRRRARILQSGVVGVALVAAVLGGVVLAQSLSSRSAFLLAVMAIAVGSVIIVWHIDPAWTMCGAIALSVFSGHWQEIGLPALVAPDRLLVMAVIVMILVAHPLYADGRFHSVRRTCGCWRLHSSP